VTDFPDPLSPLQMEADRVHRMHFTTTGAENRFQAPNVQDGVAPIGHECLPKALFLFCLRPDSFFGRLVQLQAFPIFPHRSIFIVARTVCLALRHAERPIPRRMLTLLRQGVLLRGKTGHHRPGETSKGHICRTC
jgi:hypothetical protein